VATVMKKDMEFPPPPKTSGPKLGKMKNRTRKRRFRDKGRVSRKKKALLRPKKTNPRRRARRSQTTTRSKKAAYGQGSEKKESGHKKTSFRRPKQVIFGQIPARGGDRRENTSPPGNTVPAPRTKTVKKGRLCRPPKTTSERSSAFTKEWKKHVPPPESLDARLHA